MMSVWLICWEKINFSFSGCISQLHVVTCLFYNIDDTVEIYMNFNFWAPRFSCACPTFVRWRIVSWNFLPPGDCHASMIGISLRVVLKLELWLLDLVMWFFFLAGEFMGVRLFCHTLGSKVVLDKKKCSDINVALNMELIINNPECCDFLNILVCMLEESWQAEAKHCSSSCWWINQFEICMRGFF